jgi:ferredoxin, 2Fe-2S
MIALTFVTHDGARVETQARAGTTLMDAARMANVPGILAECGGACACSTCHVYVDPDWLPKLDDADEMEADLLDFVWEPDPTRSRLACRITLTDALAGLVVDVPAKQG